MRMRHIITPLVMLGLATACVDSTMEPDATLGEASLSKGRGGSTVEICPDGGDWVYDGIAWTLDGPNDLGSRKFDTDGNLNALFISAPSGYLISGFCAKAGTTTTTVAPSDFTPSATYTLDVGNNRAISHFSLTFIRETREPEWCSPGYWRANATNREADAWPVATDMKYADIPDAPEISLTQAGHRANATLTPTLLEVLQNPSWYGGAAFNAVGDYLSTEAGLNVQTDADGNIIRASNCPLDNANNG